MGAKRVSAIHWNPFKHKVYYVKNENTEPVASEEEEIEFEPMPWKDAAKVAVILMLVELFSDFFVSNPLPIGCALNEVAIWMWTLFIFAGKKFLITFAALTGLTLLSKPILERAKKKD